MLEPKKKLMRRTSSEKQNSPNPKITAAKEAAKNAMQGYIGGMASGKAAGKALEKKKKIEKGRPKTGEMSVPFTGNDFGKRNIIKEKINKIKDRGRPTYTSATLVRKTKEIKKPKGNN